MIRAWMRCLANTYAHIAALPTHNGIARPLICLHRGPMRLYTPRNALFSSTGDLVKIPKSSSVLCGDLPGAFAASGLTAFLPHLTPLD